MPMSEVDRNKLDLEYWKAKLERLQAHIREYEAECELAMDNVNYFTRIIDGYEKMEEDREDG